MFYYRKWCNTRSMREMLLPECSELCVSSTEDCNSGGRRVSRFVSALNLIPAFLRGRERESEN